MTARPLTTVCTPSPWPRAWSAPACRICARTSGPDCSCRAAPPEGRASTARTTSTGCAASTPCSAPASTWRGLRWCSNWRRRSLAEERAAARGRSVGSSGANPDLDVPAADPVRLHAWRCGRPGRLPARPRSWCDLPVTAASVDDRVAARLRHDRRHSGGRRPRWRGGSAHAAHCRPARRTRRGDRHRAQPPRHRRAGGEPGLVGRAAARAGIGVRGLVRHRLEPGPGRRAGARR